jgi:hypothetical protein
MRRGGFRQLPLPQVLLQLVSPCGVAMGGTADLSAALWQMEGTVDLSAAPWQKSACSGSNGCVEIAFVDGRVAVRSSKYRERPVLVLAPKEWDAFLGGVAGG